MSLRLDYKNCKNFITEDDISNLSPAALEQLRSLKDKSGKGNDFLGWLSLPEEANKQLKMINETATRLKQQAETTVIIGIGGSYLGAKSVIEVLKPAFPSENNNTHEVIFAGQNISEDYMSNLLEYLSGAAFNMLVISKSGTTTEPAIAFRLLKKQLEETIGKNALAKHIVAITDKERGALKKLADNEAYETFVIPDDVGGRYSVLTPVGLLPLAVAGLNIDEFVKGALEMAGRTRDNDNPANNPAITYALIRNILYRNGKLVEMLVNFEPGLHYIAEWWKQLFGESEGKNGKGIFPASANFTTDLHSLGQYIQDGERILFETVLSVKDSEKTLLIPHDDDNLDSLNYIAGKRISEVNSKAEEGTIMAHVDGGVPVIRIELPALNEKTIGQLLYFFEISCGISGYLLGVNPFDQPGVEAYKRNMFRLLGK